MCIRDSYSHRWVKKNVLMMNDDEIDAMTKEMDSEKPQQKPESGEDEEF